MVNWKTCTPSKETAAGPPELIIAMWKFELSIAECPEFSREAGNSSFYVKFFVYFKMRAVTIADTYTNPHTSLFGL